MMLIALALFVILIALRFFLGLGVLKKSDAYIEQLAKTYNQGNGATIDQPILNATDPTLGQPKAKNILVLFSDFQCPYCAEAAKVLSGILNKRGKDIFLVWKDMPNPLHPEAKSASIAARCAQAQGKFWEYHNQLFLNQTSLSQALYSSLAKDLNLDAKLFQQCVDNQEPLPQIQTAFNLGLALGLDGTPYLFVNGERLNGVFTAAEVEGLLK